MEYPIKINLCIDLKAGKLAAIYPTNHKDDIVIGKVEVNNLNLLDIKEK
jgi:hypothetical protein